MSLPLHPGAVNRLIIAALALRLVAAAVLVAGPWTDDPDELDGWDVARFQEIADTPGRPYADHPVEYPPGTVVAIEAVGGSGVVETHRRLVITSLVVDGLVAATVGAIGGRAAAGRYLLLGVPLIPMGLLRIDLWAALLAVLAVAALAQRRPVAFAVLTIGGALVKVWPALAIAAAVGVRRGSAAGAAVLVGAVAGIGWVAAAGWSLDGIDQVVSLRGATGWHVESLPGAIVALVGDSEAERQLDAYRIGELSPGVVAAGRAATALVVGTAVVLGRRRTGARSDPAATTGPPAADIDTVAAVLLAGIAALIVTAPLLSPQFLLWLMPWAALLSPSADHPHRPPTATLLTGAAAVVTGATLGRFGPPGVDATVPAALLTLRNVLLIAVVAAALRSLAGPVRPNGTPAGEPEPHPRPSSCESADR